MPFLYQFFLNSSEILFKKKKVDFYSFLTYTDSEYVYAKLESLTQVFWPVNEFLLF